MSIINNYFGYSQLSFAAYAEGLVLDNGVSTISKYIDQNFTRAQADQFVDSGWEVVHQSDDAKYGGSGFSATLFRNTQSGEYVFANRGTAGAQDLWVDAWGITALGVAGSQVIDMFRYYKQLTTPDGQAVSYSSVELETLYQRCVYLYLRIRR